MDKYVKLCLISFVTDKKTISRLERLEQLTALVKSDDPVTLGDVATELGVSLRTVTRDIEVLREQGLPIEADRGRGGGVRLAQTWGVGRMNLTYHEAVDLLISLAAAEQMESPLFMAHLGSIRRKLMASFGPGLGFRVRDLKNRVKIGKPASIAMLENYAPPAPEPVRQIHQAFVGRRRLEIDYYSMQNVSSQRQIEPHYLLFCSPIWYVLAWDELRGDVRTFRCDRIRAATQAATRATTRATNSDRFNLRPIEDFATALEGVAVL